MACDPALAVERAVRMGAGRIVLCNRPVLLNRKGRLIVVALGKAAPRMVEGLMARVGQTEMKRTIRGLLVSPRDDSRQRPPAAPAGLASAHGEHPIPGRSSFAAARKALALLSRAGERDDVVFLVSGGGSALLASPLTPYLNAAQKAGLHRVLLASGAPIGSINTVRKHLSAVKGGRLAVAARRARSQTTLVVCDVDPERYEEVASGPSLADRSTLEDMVSIIDRYGFATALPVRILEALRAGRLPETPKPGERVFRKSRSQMILSNRDLRNAAVRTGLSQGLSAEAHPYEVIGPVEESVESVARAIEAAPPGTRLLVLGGEVLNVPSGPGMGGRAQEFALRLVLRMSGLPARPWAFLACGSDGRDGNSPAAGAFADSSTLDRALATRLDPAKALRDSQSYRFFKRLKNDVTLPPTGTNVRDIYLLLTGDPLPATRAKGSSGPGAILV